MALYSLIWPMVLFIGEKYQVPFNTTSLGTGHLEWEWVKEGGNRSSLFLWYLFYNFALKFVKTSGFIALGTSAQTTLKCLEIDTSTSSPMHAKGQEWYTRHIPYIVTSGIHISMCMKDG